MLNNSADGERIIPKLNARESRDLRLVRKKSDLSKLVDRELYVANFARFLLSPFLIIVI